MLTIHFKNNSQCGGFDESNPVASILAACDQRGWKKESVKGYSIGEISAVPTNIGIEVSRTAAGEKVATHSGAAWLEEVRRRVVVRWEETSRNETSVYGRVYTNTDGNGWTDEGIYLLSSTTKYIYPDVVPVEL